MKRYQRLLQKLLYPHAALLTLLALFSAWALVTVFTRGLENSAFAYIVYAISAYATAAAVLRGILLFRSGKRRLHEIPFFHRYLTDLDFKAEVSIYLSFGVTAFYSLYKALIGAYYRSAWFGSMAFYYIVLGTLRFLLLRDVRKRRQPPLQMLKRYRFCGYLLLALTAALGAMSFHAIYDDKAIRYPGYMIYAAAGFTFYNLTMAVYNLLRYRRIKNPIYSASKALALAAGAVSLFFLQTSMFAEFGSGGALQRYMNMATAAAVFLLILCMAVLMIVSVSRAIAELSAQNKTEPDA